MATTTIKQFETGHADTVHDAEFDYYGKKLATCSSDRMIKIFDIVGGQVGYVCLNWMGRAILVCISSPLHRTA